MAPKGIKGSSSSQRPIYEEDRSPPSDSRSERRSRGEPSTRQYGSSLAPPERSSNRTSGGSSSSGSTRAMARYARHLDRGELTPDDAVVHAEIEGYRLGDLRTRDLQHPVARAIVRHAGQFMEEGRRGPTNDRTNAITAALADLLDEPAEAPVAPSVRSSQPVRSSRIEPPPLPPDAHLRVSNAIGSHLSNQKAPVDPETQMVIDEMVALEVSGARPPQGSPMRPIADIMFNTLPVGSGPVDRQNVMFLALSGALGVHPHEVMGPPDPATGLPSNTRFVVREASTMAGWMAEVATLNADPATSLAAQQINDFIETGAIPSSRRMDPDTAQLIESASRETSPSGSPSNSPHSRPGVLEPRRANGPEEAMARRNAVARALLAVMKNEGGGAWRKGAYSGANSLMRNVVTVMAPTMLRQYLDQGIATRMDRLSEQQQLGLSLMAALIPPTLLTIGAYTDRDVATTASNVSRATLALVSLGAIAAAVATDNMASVGPALIGFLTYAALRDLGQRFIKLDTPDASAEMRLGTTLKGAAAYVANQTVAGAAMTYGASPSGAGAAGLSPQILNGFLRGVINMAAETGDDLTYGSFASREMGKPLRLTLSGKIPPPSDLMRTYTRSSPARATLSTVDAMLGTVVASALAQTNLGPTAQNNLTNFFEATVLGALYAAFLHIHQEPPEAAPDPERGSLPRIDLPSDGHGETFGMERLSVRDDRSIRSSNTAFTGNLGLGGGSASQSPRPSREASTRALPPSTRVPSTRSRSSSVQGLAPSPYVSRPPSIRRDYPPPRDERFDDRGLSDNPLAPQTGPFLAPPPQGQFGNSFGSPYPPPLPPQPPADRLRERFNRGGGGGFEGPPPPHMQQSRAPSIRSHHSDSTAFYSFESESAESRYYTPGGSNRSQRSRRSEDDDPDYR